MHPCFLHLYLYVILLLILLLLPARAAGADGFIYGGFTGADLTRGGTRSLRDPGRGLTCCPGSVARRVAPCRVSALPRASALAPRRATASASSSPRRASASRPTRLGEQPQCASWRWRHGGSPAGWRGLEGPPGGQGDPGVVPPMDLTMDGVASVTDGLLRLTSGLSESTGHAFYTYPITSSSNGSAASFFTTFVFAINGTYPDLSGHGFAFVLSSTKELFNALPAQYLGLFNTWNDGNASDHLLAIEFDTSLSIEFNDINDNHIGFMTTCPTELLLRSNKLSSRRPRTKLLLSSGALESFGEDAPLNYSALHLKTVLGAAHRPPRRLNYIQRGWSFKLQVHVPTLALIAILVLALVVTVHICMKRRSKARKHKHAEWEIELGTPSFKYKDLVAATNGFKDKMLLGRGGFGRVYKGVMPLCKQVVAIKRVSPESKQGMKEFVAEVAILGRVRHRNLVQLLGYCRYKKELLLVYDYMPNGSLAGYLYNQGRSSLDWDRRFRIIKGIASGLFYLHEDWEQVVIHRDIKTSNVLLDTEMNGRLGDFGLARLHDHGADAHTTHVAGTWGYIAPELARLGKATKATDVFAFGVFMMEVACGRRPIGATASGEPLVLADWVLAAWRGGSILDAMDPRLDGDYVAEEAETVLKLALLSSHSSPNARPCMRLVMQYLERDAPLPDFQPSLLSTHVSPDEMHDQHVMSCPSTNITDLSKGR